MHHLVADASSVDLIFRELLMLYHAFSAEMPSPLSEPRLQYADFAVWQRSYVSGESNPAAADVLEAPDGWSAAVFGPAD